MRGPGTFLRDPDCNTPGESGDEDTMTRSSAALISGFVVAILLSYPAGVQAQSARPFPERSASSFSQRVTSWGAFFPLEVGSEWVYAGGTTRFTVQVLQESREANGRVYFEVSGYFPDDGVRVRKLRHGSSGEILEYNPGGEDFLWYRFGPYRGAWRFETGGGLTCISGSEVRTGDFGERVEVAAGTFDDTLRLDFLTPCADAGVSREYFARGVGLVRREVTTIAGPRVVELVSATVGSKRFPRTPYGVAVSVDRPVYFNNFMPPVLDPVPTLKAAIVLRNRSDTPLALVFPTAQRFDFVLRDARGREISRWSDGRAFTQQSGQETPVGGSLVYSADIRLADRGGSPLAAGFYSLIGYLTTSGSDPGLFALGGSVVFEIRDLH